jgi:hypothetical protein
MWHVRIALENLPVILYEYIVLDECTACAKTYYKDAESCVFFCSQIYYMDSTTYDCVEKCPVNLFYDDDRTGTKICIAKCVVEKFQHLDTCYFVCPDGFYGEPATGLCTLCSLECLTCNGGTNQDCTVCTAGFTRNEFGGCIG